MWKKYTFELTDAKFANRTNGADFRIAIISSTEWSSSDVCIQNISVAKLQQASDVTTNTTSGKVDKGTAVTLSSTTSNSAIYYTTDGSDPKASTSKQKYNKPIIINSCTTIKAFAVSDTTAKSNISTFSYFSTYVNTIFTNIAQFNGITAYPADDPSKLQITTKGGKQCWKTNISNNMKYIYCDIDNNYIFGGTNKVGITVEYFDEGNGQFFYVL